MDERTADGRTDGVFRGGGDGGVVIGHVTELSRAAIKRRYDAPATANSFLLHVIIVKVSLENKFNLIEEVHVCY